MNKRCRLKGIRLGETLETLQNEHLEIQVKRNLQTGEIEEIHFPEDHNGYIVIYNKENIIYLDYSASNGEHVVFPL